MQSVLLYWFPSSVEVKTSTPILPYSFTASCNVWGWELQPTVQSLPFESLWWPTLNMVKPDFFCSASDLRAGIDFLFIILRSVSSHSELHGNALTTMNSICFAHFTVTLYNFQMNAELFSYCVVVTRHMRWPCWSLQVIYIAILFSVTLGVSNKITFLLDKLCILSTISASLYS